jgi:lysine decarboxylase
LLAALRELTGHASELPLPAHVDLPTPDELLLEQVVPPRDAFFGPLESVPIEQAAGRIGAELISPYPPGVPAVVPGERINQPVAEYLRTAVEAGTYVPDTADPAVRHVRVVRE